MLSPQNAPSEGCTRLGGVVCVVAPAANPQASAGRMDIQPGCPANDTASQPGHRARDEARVVLKRQGQPCPALPSARGRLPGQGGGGLARPRGLVSLPLLHRCHFSQAWPQAPLALNSWRLDVATATPLALCRKHRVSLRPRGLGEICFLETIPWRVTEGPSWQDRAAMLARGRARAWVGEQPDTLEAGREGTGWPQA